MFNRGCWISDVGCEKFDIRCWNGNVDDAGKGMNTGLGMWN